MTDKEKHQAQAKGQDADYVYGLDDGEQPKGAR